jgi:hypothetical protein
MAGWWSIAVFDGEFPATQWRDSSGAQLVESALTHGAADWEWHIHRWGVVFEVTFRDGAQWAAFRALPEPGEERVADLTRAELGGGPAGPADAGLAAG